MEKSYGISIVIPNYNHAEYLPDCLKSIALQTYPINEIIVVDDCSTDHSVSVLAELKKQYRNLTVIQLEKNGKVSHARNVGLSHVKTPYVTFMDSDDIYYNPRKIENEMKLIRQYEAQHKQIAAYSRIAVVSEDGKEATDLCYKQKYYLQGRIFKDVLTRRYFFTIMRDYCMPTQVMRDTGGYNEENCLYEDLESILALSKKLEFYYTGEVGTGYRQTSNGLSKAAHDKHVKKLKEIFEKNVQEFSPIRRAMLRTLLQYHLLQNELFDLWRRAKRKIRRMVARQ